MSMQDAADSDAAQLSERSNPRKPRSRGLVTIFGTWCKGCGICIEFCPQGVFIPDGQGRPIIAHPEKCTACKWCEMHCPDMAITVRRLEPEEIEELEGLTDLAEQGALPGGGL